MKLYRILLGSMVLVTCVLSGCADPKPWPSSPLYTIEGAQQQVSAFENKEAIYSAIAGNYAQYNIVAYQGDTPNGPLNTFIVSYGFTDLRLVSGQLVAQDRFCFSEQIANQNFVSRFSDAATQAIIPPLAPISVSFENNRIQLYRPATPTLLGISGDPNVTLTTDPNTPLLIDSDRDGKPGVTVDLTLFGLIKAELYIARREIYSTRLTLYEDGKFYGTVTDNSEQLVAGASLGFLAVPNNPLQREDQGLNPIILVPVAPEFTDCNMLKRKRHELFPPTPTFH